MDLQEKEPMLLLDTTFSMHLGTSPTDPTPRKDTIREAIGMIVAALASEDSQAGEEDEDEGGGLRTVTFAGGAARDIGDLNPANLRAKWGAITWKGDTQIVPGWRTLLDVYSDEFGDRPIAQRPLLMALVITDGVADDAAEFAQAVAQASDGVYVVLAIIGFGHNHDKAIKAYQAVEQHNAHVKVVTFGGETNPEVIAKALLRMIA